LSKSLAANAASGIYPPGTLYPPVSLRLRREFIVVFLHVAVASGSIIPDVVGEGAIVTLQNVLAFSWPMTRCTVTGVDVVLTRYSPPGVGKTTVVSLAVVKVSFRFILGLRYYRSPFPYLRLRFSYSHLRF